jgi:hypothetical protein
MKYLGFFAAACALLGAGFVMGRVSVPQASFEARGQKIPIQLVQNAAPQTPPQAPNDPRELIPLGPNGQQPGQGQGQQPQPGQGQAPEDCPVQIYQDGQLFTFPRPGQQPGQGQGNQPGQPGGAQELIPLNPSTPSTPSTPNTPNTPNTPGTPQNPRS